jgi:hypothetical protein
MSSASEHEPNPSSGQHDVADYVLRDIQERVAAGYQKYGTKLQTFNRRDPLWDLYQELIDAVMYIRQEILERDSYKKKIEEIVELTYYGLEHKEYSIDTLLNIRKVLIRRDE